MKILAIEKEKAGNNASSYEPYLKEEAKQVWELNQRGIIREIYFTEGKKAVLIMECEGKEEALNILSTLPLVKEGLIEFTINSLRPYNGFERLFTL
jgi:hypothetical protein